MTISMPDSIYTASLPGGYRAYLGYADGNWPTAAKIPPLFPGARVLSLTVLAGTLAADGVDVEPGNPNAASGAAWISRKLASAPASHPVAYADLASDGYSMSDVLTELGRLGIARPKVRLLTAHYTGKAHICSPAACGTSFTADGTQWTNSFPGAGGSSIDMSLLNDDFFGATAPVTSPAEDIMQQLPVVKQGQSGDAVRTVQALCGARGHATAVDGAFGPATVTAVKAVQTSAKIGVDGIVGPQTWPALLGV